MTLDDDDQLRAERIAPQLARLLVDWMFLAGPALVARLGMGDTVKEQLLESIAAGEDLPDEALEQLNEQLEKVFGQEALSPEALREQARSIAARSATLLREVREGLEEHEGHGCSFETVYDEIVPLLQGTTEAAATLLALTDAEQIDLGAIFEIGPGVGGVSDEITEFLLTYVDDEDPELAKQLQGMVLMQKRLAGAETVRYRTTLEFGPVPVDTLHGLADPPEGPIDESMTLGERLGISLANLPYAAIEALRRRGEPTDLPLDPSVLEVGHRHDEDDPDLLYIEIGLANAYSWVFETCGLVHHLEQAEVDWRIEDEWSPASFDEVYVFQWHHGMDKGLVRRGRRDENGDVAFELGVREYALFLSAFPDDSKKRDQLVMGYVYLDPGLGDEIDDATLDELRLLAATLEFGAALNDQLPAGSRLSDGELTPLAANARTARNVEGDLVYLGEGAQPFSIDVWTADMLIIDLLEEALERGDLDGPLRSAGISKDEASWIIEEGGRDDERRLFDAVVAEVSFVDDENDPVVLVFRTAG